MLSNEEMMSTLLSERLSLTAYVATITQNYHLAEDVFQDICLKAMGRGSEFETTDHLLNWAHVTGRNRAIDILRARDGKYQGLNSEVLEALTVVWNTEKGVVLREKREALRHCLQQLTANNQQILRLRYFEGRTGSDVAELLGRKLATVYQALARIHKTLAECVRQQMLMLEGER